MNEDKKEPIVENQGAPFNSAIACLMRLDGILIDIKNLVLKTGKEFDKGFAQQRKYYLVRQFYVQATPLIKNEDDRKKIKEMLGKIKLEYSDGLNHGFPCKYPSYSFQIENALDEIIITIEESLQRDGFYMPSKDDGGL